MSPKKKIQLEDLSCRRRVALLCDYLDKELPSAERELVAAHRRSCRPCALVLRSLERTVARLRAVKRLKAPAAARRSWRAALAGRRPPR